MCGRARLSSDVTEIKLVFSIPPHRPSPNFPPSWNVAPTDSLPVVRYDSKAGERSLDMLRWGLVPFWANRGITTCARTSAPLWATRSRWRKDLTERIGFQSIAGSQARPEPNQISQPVAST
jgi:putative SOS response-associated peptidase YedK